MNPYKYAFFACWIYIGYDRGVIQSVWTGHPLAASTGTDNLGTDIATSLTDSVSTQAPHPEKLLEKTPLRKLASSDSSNTSVSASSSAISASAHEAHVGHPHDALFFLFNALCIGVFILHLTSLPRFHSLQMTVCLFVLGIIYSLLQTALNLKEHLGPFGISYDMWMRIDPHLLLFSMLPALLAGDAMTIDTTVARSVAKQCLFLAGPGVVFGSVSTALFLKVYLPYDWPNMLCLVCGSILAATDPVAVVGLLKELGASPTLTVQIQGESLLNDGTAIVLYSIAYDILKGEEYDASEIVIFLIKVAGCAIILGIVIGYIFLTWIRLACSRLDHSAGTIQTALTLCCAYWSFCIAEGALHISGVLCTVSASLVLADKMWPSIVDKHSLHQIWHMFEYLGNVIIFFLAGALTGKAMTQVGAMDYLHLGVIYVVCMVIRATLLFGCRPILGMLSLNKEPVSLADAAVMSWGGLRGAVGLALAIQVAIDRADGKLSELDGQRVLFYVGGVATLTLVVNALTCPMLVRKLGVTNTPQAKQNMLYRIHSQLYPLMMEGNPRKEVHDALVAVLADVKHHIDHLVEHGAMEQRSQAYLVPNEEIIRMLRASKEQYLESEADNQNLDKLGMPDLPNIENEGHLEKLLETECNPDSQKAVNEAFLSLVEHHYWAMVDRGDFVSGSSDAEVLLSSVSRAFKHSAAGIGDLRYVLHRIIAGHKDCDIDCENLLDLLESLEASGFGLHSHPALGHQGSSGSVGLAMTHKWTDRAPKGTLQNAGRIARFIESHPFNVFMCIVLMANSVFILVEQRHRKGSNYDDAAWMVLEVGFNLCFLLEFILKIFGLGPVRYFCSAWDQFDFALLILGVVGIGIELASDGEGAETASNEARLFRLNRVFRVLRVLRIVRLIKFMQVVKANIKNEDVSPKLAEHLKTILICRAFVSAHVNAQVDVVKFFAWRNDDGMGQCSVKTPEVARTLLESQTAVYQAIYMAADGAQPCHVPPKTLSGMTHLWENVQITGELSTFIAGAFHAGVINGREADMMSHPLQTSTRMFAQLMTRAVDGRTSIKVTSTKTSCLSDSGMNKDFQESWNVGSFSALAHKAAETDRLDGSIRLEGSVRLVTENEVERRSTIADLQNQPRMLGLEREISSPAPSRPGTAGSQQPSPFPSEERYDSEGAAFPAAPEIPSHQEATPAQGLPPGTTVCESDLSEPM